MHDEGWMAAEGPILGSMALGPPCVFAGLLRTCRSRTAPSPETNGKMSNNCSGRLVTSVSEATGAEM